MRVTRIISLMVIASSVGLTALDAQTLRNASPPAEFPPASYKGKQYVDSKGCIYIRAGIDGNVEWIPRVTRDRKHVCGYRPTAVAGTTKAPARSASAPTVITLDAPVAAAPTKRTATRTVPDPAPKRVARQPSPDPKPTTFQTDKSTATTTTRSGAVKRTARVPSPGPEPTTFQTSKPASSTASATTRTVTAPKRTTRKPSPASGPTTFTTTKPTQTARTTSTPNTTVTIAPRRVPEPTVRLTDRVVPRHVYDSRRNTTNVKIPKGYRAVWDDGRLNPHRAERTLKPAIAVTPETFKVPRGYRVVERQDDRFNPKRGIRTTQGDAGTDAIWSRTVPRTLVKLPTDRRVVKTPKSHRHYAGAVEEPGVIRVSSRSDANAPKSLPVRRQWVRASIHRTKADAQAAAQRLAATGLPVRHGKLKRKDGTYSVVLAGPFTSKSAAKSALNTARQAGFSKAKLSR